MVYYNVMFPRDEAWEIMNKLGHLGLLHFEDSHKGEIATHRPFALQVAEIQHTLGKLDELEKIIREHGYIDAPINIDNDLCREINVNIDAELESKLSSEYFQNMKNEIYTRYNIAKEMTDDYKVIEQKAIDSNNYINALEMFNSTMPSNKGSNRTKFNTLNVKVQLDYMLGVIPNEDLAKFQRALFRLTRGNAYASFSNVNTKYDMKNKEKMPNKSVFFVAFTSSKGEVLEKKLRRLCEALNARLFEIPENIFDLTAELEKAHNDNKEAMKVLKSTEIKIFESLKYFFLSKNNLNVPYITQIRVALVRQLGIYENLNKFLLNGNLMEGFIWVPQDEEFVYQDYVSGSKKSSEFLAYRHIRINYKKLKKEPPTFIKTNEITMPFQEIVNTYGFPAYKEANPGLFTIITFPFLFGVMFGDVGHGLLLTSFAISLYLTNKHYLPAVKPFRYLLLFMGIFATFCGLMYNEFLSIPIPLFKSCYRLSGDKYVKDDIDCVYPIGFDYTWDLSSNSISFVNSFKMKLSVIIGVLHMLLGIFMKGLNGLQFKDYLSFFFEFLPQFLFMIATFGYMCVCIVIKWLTYYPDSSKAPSIIAIFINLVGKVQEPLYATASVQETVQLVLVIVAFLCVPLMWIVKPLVVYVRSRSHDTDHDNRDYEPESRKKHSLTNYDDESEVLLSRKDTEIKAEDDSDHHDVSELFVHQSIETIEFILGSVSNTASYLRLWALSLAHSQLARVFLDMLVKPFYEGNGNPYSNAIGIILTFLIFMIVTTAVLMLMDVMECFLHALRLHWVEFQNKFYKGNGHPYREYEHNKAIMQLLNES